MKNYDKISKDNRIFINELKKRCLKFNKYNRRIDTKSKWEEFNNLEQRMLEDTKFTTIDEDTICSAIDIKSVIGEEKYNFLIYYYSYGYAKTAIQYNLSPDNTRKRASLILKDLRSHFGISGKKKVN